MHPATQPAAPHDAPSERAVDRKTTTPTAEASTAENLRNFESYWAAFRSAVERDDRSRVAELTHFPLEARGMDDDDPTRSYSRNQFMAFYQTLMEQELILVDGRLTQKQLIIRTTQLSNREYRPGDLSARVGDLYFEKRDGRWWLIHVYVDES